MSNPARLRALLADTTPGPWAVGQSALCDHRPRCYNVWSDGAEARYQDVTGPCARLSEADATLIVEVINALPCLLDALDEAHARIAELKAEVARLRGPAGCWTNLRGLGRCE